MSSLYEFYAQLDGYITQRMEARRTPGISLALFNRGRNVRVSTYGFSDLETQAPVAPDTLFGIGSITKTFTAVAVLQAAERGLLDLQAPVTDYLPWFEVQSRYQPITLHHLLAHSAGIVGIIDRSPDTRASAWALRETETAWPPGAHFYYSDAGYQVLALVLAQVYGQPFQEILRAKVLEPLGMTASEPAFTHAMRPRAAQGYRTLYDDRPPHTSYPLVPAAWIEMNAGDCCIASTAEDLARFARMLLNRGQGPNGPLLSQASYERLIHEPMDTEYGFKYGYGIEVHQRDGVAHLGHGGSMPGYEAFMLIDVDRGLGVTLLSTEPSIDVRDLAWTVMTMWRKASLGESVEAVDLSLPDPTHVENAADFAGTYRGARRTLKFAAEGDKLVLCLPEDRRWVLEKRGEDAFYVPHPDLARFLLRFGRAATDGEEPGEVDQVCHGGDWYVGECYAGPRAFEHPVEWHACPGHYRSHIPWQTNFRVVLRKGALQLVWPAGDEEPLTPVDEGVFRIGDETSPERLRFSQLVQGQALCANLSGSDYYRFFVP
jgi:CubicO group peptidase (beta-lactamase class C family)